MYAAAGGASLASRQARQRQRQQKKTQQLQAKLHPPKALAISVADHGASTPTRQSRQFHQLPTNYLRTPQAQVRKLSASYTAQSKLLLPIDEGDTQSVLQMRMHGQSQGTGSHVHHAHSHAHAQHQHQFQQQQQQHYHHYTGSHYGRVSPKLVHRHSGSSGTSFHHSHLPKSATATLPLVSQMLTSPDDQQETQTGVLKEQDITAETQPLTAATEDVHDIDDQIQPPHAPLERKCSVYRMRRSDAFEHEEDTGAAGLVKKQFKELQFHQQQYEPLPIDEPQPQLMFKGRKWQPCAYCEEGICVCEHIECAQGRAAWLERGRRCSVQDQQQQATCHRRWVKRNRIQDASLGGSSDDEDFLGVLRGPSTFANAFLYVGLGTVALGLVIAFVGTGEKGFKTVELRLIGPSLIILGLICCILRILFCICPSNCISSSKKTRRKNGIKVDADHTTSLLRNESKRVSIARGPGMQPKYPLTHKRSNSKMLNEGMEALRQLATTSLFMQNEQKPPTNRVVPIIKEPDNTVESNLEMKRLETALNVSEVSDENPDQKVNKLELFTNSTNLKESESSFAYTTTTKTITSSTIDQPNTIINTDNERPQSVGTSSKLARQRVALNKQTEQSQSLSSSSTVKDSIHSDMEIETSLMIIKPVTLEIEARPPITTSVPLPLTTECVTTVPATLSGGFSRILTNQQSLTQDLPPATPHTYSSNSGFGTYRSTGSETLIRGPLGMPLSALASSSLSKNALSLTTPNTSATTTTTVSLLPLPAPPTAVTTISSASKQYNIPGQVMEHSITNSQAAHPTSTPSNLDANTLSSLLAATSNEVDAATINLQHQTNSASVLSSGGHQQSSQNSNFNKLEPELLLSPAKLGQ